MKEQQNLEREIKEVKQLLTLQADVPLGIDEACKFTGFKKSYLYKLTHKKQIPHFKPNNKKIIFSKNELREWLFRNKQTSRQEIESEAEEILKRNNA